ncbi:MAG: gamma-glutamylcyclotransferase family protein [Pyrinomonadaceae bacterium]
MLYFAYGSNLDRTQMLERCVSAKFVCIAKADGFRLAFTHRSRNRNCGAADMVLFKDNEVWGVVYQIDATDVELLDKSEGYRPKRDPEKNSYGRVELHVYGDGDENHPLAVSTYVVVPTKRLDPNPRPSIEYKKLIVDGARHWRLPEHYIKQLEAIETQ